MWESPIYKVKAKINGEEKDILIDVTGSAPNFKEPMKQLESTLGVLLDKLKPKETTILDFGAAKLRNTLYLLKKGFTVYSCEFKNLFERSKQAKDFYEECKKFENFKPLIFPDDFIKCDIKFDVILLINVLNIMPVPIERMCVLYLCRKKINERGRLLWYTQHGGYNEENAVGLLYDGLVTGKGREFHMFYRDFSRKEIHDMLESTGFSFNKDSNFPMSGTNQAYVFNPSGDILIDKTLGLSSLLEQNNESKLKKIERHTRWGVEDEGKKSKKIKYEAKIPKRVIKIEGTNLLNTYLRELLKIKAGKRKAHQYHLIIFNILKSLFENRLKKPKMEDSSFADGIKRVDITFKNKYTDCFFGDLDKGYHLTCPNIMIECKNYNDDLKDREFTQLQGRLNKVRGQFGILICRKVNNLNNIRKRQDECVKKGDYIIVLEDKDIEKLVKFKIDNKEDEIDNYLEEKFKRLT